MFKTMLHILSKLQMNPSKNLYCVLYTVQCTRLLLSLPYMMLIRKYSQSYHEKLARDIKHDK